MMKSLQHNLKLQHCFVYQYLTLSVVGRM